MQGKTHILCGMACGLAVATAVVGNNPESVGVLVGASAIGGLVPDIDHTHSMLGKRVPFVSCPILVLNKIFNFFANHTKGKLRKFFKYIAKMFGHRGICHSGILWAAFLWLAYQNLSTDVVSILLLGLAVGGMSHLIADTLNPSGIGWLLPITDKRISLARITTGSNAEMVFRVVILLLDAFLIYRLF